MLLMGAALWSVFCVSDHDLRAVQFELLDRFPPLAVCDRQARAWRVHWQYLQDLEERVPGDRDRLQAWRQLCVSRMRLWSLLECLQEEFPEVWRTGWYPPLLPEVLRYAPLPPAEPPQDS